MNTVTRGFLVFAGLVAFIAFACVLPAFFWLPQAGQGVSLPVITLPAEVLVPNIIKIGDATGMGWLDLTNTMTHLLFVDVVLIIVGIVVFRATAGKRSDEFVPKGFTNFVELITEFLYNQGKNLLGNNVGKVFPVAATIFAMILVANWSKLIPGVESVGLLSCAEPNWPSYRLSGYNDGVPGAFLRNDFLVLGDRAGLKPKTTKDDLYACEEKYPELTPPLVVSQKERGTYPGEKSETGSEAGKAEGTPEATGEATKGAEATAEATSAATKASPAQVSPDVAAANAVGGGKGDPERFVVLPFFRALATDLNFPLALAIFVVLAVQFWGVSALGPAYFFKFINIPALGNLAKKPLGAIDFVVGIIEIISEISRIVSLTFRLFGSIFAGGILVIVLSFLVAAVLPAPFYLLEIFIGLIQAYVFATLTFIYASQAMTAHHGDDHDDHGDHH